MKRSHNASIIETSDDDDIKNTKVRKNRGPRTKRKKLIDDEEEEASNSSSGGGQILFSTITKTSDHEISEQSKVRKNRGPRSKRKKSIEEDEEEEPTNGSSGGGQILFSTFGRTTSPTPSPTPSSKTNDAVDDDDENDGEHVSIEPSVEFYDNSDDETHESDDNSSENISMPWWEPDKETGKFVETGPNITGIKFKKMRIKIGDDRLLVNHVNQGNGNIRCHVRLPNVRKTMKMLEMPLDTSVVMETRTLETHPLICPFADPANGEPCTVMFKKSEQKYFNMHVIKGECPFSQISQMTRMMYNREFRCEKCQEIVAEEDLQKHVEEKHLTVVCPGCKSRHESRMHVEDHIINEHATHFMSMLPAIYRKSKPPPKPEPEPKPVEDSEALSDYMSLEDVIKEEARKKEEEARERAERERMFKEQAQYLAGLKGHHQAAKYNQFMSTMNGKMMLPPMNKMPIQRMPNRSMGQKMVIPKTTPGNGAADPYAHNANGVTTKVQQLRLATGELMWALATGVEPIPGSEKSKIMYKVLGPVVPGQPPPTVIIRPTAAPPTSGGQKTYSRGLPNQTMRPPAPIAPMRAPVRPSNSLYNSQLRMRREAPTVIKPVSIAYNYPQLHSRLQSQLLGNSNGTHGSDNSPKSVLRPLLTQQSFPTKLGVRNEGFNSLGSNNSQNNGGRSSPEVQEIEEKDPLAMDDDDEINALDPYEGDGGDDAPIIPIVNPHTETDLAADEDGDVIKTMDVSKLLQCS